MNGAEIECPECGAKIALEALHVEPGDTVVLTYDGGHLRLEYVEVLREQLRAAFGPEVKAVIVTAGTLHKESP